MDGLNSVNNKNEAEKISLSEIPFQILGWATIALFIYGIIYTFFIYEEPKSKPLDSATYQRLNDAYQRGELDIPEREGDPYLGSAY
ncbi:hypothetical protein KC865_01275 [Candidatus Kaiserbacteria bacterium]|nr:hypothetical protein [Candidatus Kaiserbacteria bacterium]MCA9364189.1 hypothetical protein [Candidatus Kaiserbacteria bacterium]